MSAGGFSYKKLFQNKKKTKDSAREGCLSFEFQAMASPCQILIETNNKSTAKAAFKIVEDEAKRIEKKFSRYTSNGIIHAINNSHGKSVEVDQETAALLDFANMCFEMSDGAFDVTSGVLRKIWQFEKKDFKFPSEKEAKELLKKIGWDKVQWKAPMITVPEDMQVDLGGIGKEYAVDRCYLLLKENFNESFLLNFGGDIIVSGPRKNNQGWIVGVEDADELLTNDPRQIIELKQGALATSGNTKRFLSHHGKVYGHILNTKTGFPVEGAPRSVSVAEKSCLNAGMLSTFAMIQGQDAENFLKEQEVKYWVQW